MIQGIGTDIIEIARIKASIERHGQAFLDKLFTKKEQEYCFSHNDPYPHFAGRFCAKEAIVKALGTGFSEMSWLDIEILRNQAGKPEVTIHAKGNPQVMVSISHCKEYAVAMALC